MGKLSLRYQFVKFTSERGVLLPLYQFVQFVQFCSPFNYLALAQMWNLPRRPAVTTVRIAVRFRFVAIEQPFPKATA